jgi:hypothetical protein
VGSGGGGGLNFLSNCGTDTIWHAGREGVGVGVKSSQASVKARYVHWLTDEYTATYIRQLTNECTMLNSLVQVTFLSAGTEGYSPVRGI